MNGAVIRLAHGIEVTEETLSVAVIDEACTGAGHFLGHPQMLALMKSEYLYPVLFDHRCRGDWEADGGAYVRAAAKARAADILGRHGPAVIPPEIDRDLRRRFAVLPPESEMRPSPGLDAGAGDA